MKSPLSLLLAVLLTFFFNSCGNTSNPQSALYSSEGPTSSNSKVEAEIRVAVNRYRASVGLSSLQAHSGLDELAADHSRAMTRKLKASHDRLRGRQRSASRRYGLNGVAENVHESINLPLTGAQIVESWINSSGHKRNMEGRFAHQGISVVQRGDYVYTTLLLGTSSVNASTLLGPDSGLVF